MPTSFRSTIKRREPRRPAFSTDHTEAIDTPRTRRSRPRPVRVHRRTSGYSAIDRPPPVPPAGGAEGPTGPPASCDPSPSQIMDGREDPRGRGPSLPACGTAVRVASFQDPRGPCAPPATGRACAGRGLPESRTGEQIPVQAGKTETRGWRNLAFLLGGPIGIRTRVSALRGPRPRPG